MKSFSCQHSWTEEKGDEGDEGTQHVLIEGKVHIPRSLAVSSIGVQKVKSPTTAHSSPDGPWARSKGRLFNTRVH